MLVVLAITAVVAVIVFLAVRRGLARRPTAAPLVVHEDDEARIEREIAFHENEARIRRLEEELERKRRDSGGHMTDSTP